MKKKFTWIRDLKKRPVIALAFEQHDDELVTWGIAFAHSKMPLDRGLVRRIAEGRAHVAHDRVSSYAEPLTRGFWLSEDGDAHARTMPSWGSIKNRIVCQGKLTPAHVDAFDIPRHARVVLMEWATSDSDVADTEPTPKVIPS